MWVWEDLFFFFIGIYFAKHAAYADKYSTSSTDLLPVFGNETQHPLSEGTKILFLARVLTGNSNRGVAHFLKPDHGTSVNTHYSCVDDTENPKIFVIFDPNQIYPEYLIQYKWRAVKAVWQFVILKTRCVTVYRIHYCRSSHFFMTFRTGESRTSEINILAGPNQMSTDVHSYGYNSSPVSLTCWAWSKHNQMDTSVYFI